jgi:hypothetical protein
MSSRRGRGTWRPNAFRPFAHQLPPDREVLLGLHPQPVRTIDKPRAPHGDERIIIKDLQYLGSYSWMDSTPATIIVPG